MADKTRIYALFGNPVGHSLSPLMHNAAFRHTGINARYTAIEVCSPREAIEKIKSDGIAGASITIPFKTGVMDYLDEMSAAALGIGAVNTIVNVRGKLLGCNTDWQGLTADLREAGLKIEGRKFAVIGAGGAARSAVYGIMHEGGVPFICNRSVERGESLARDLGCSFEDIVNSRADALINATPVGMHPLTDNSPVEKKYLSRFEWVIDLIYNPLETRLMREAREAGCQVRSGVGMLVHQGAGQFRIWTGKEPPVELMREVVEAELLRRAKS